MISFKEFLQERTISSKKVEPIDIEKLKQITRLNFEIKDDSYIVEVDASNIGEFLRFFVENSDYLEDIIENGYSSDVDSGFNSYELFDMLSGLYEEDTEDNIETAEHQAVGRIMVDIFNEQLEANPYIRIKNRYYSHDDSFKIILPHDEALYIQQMKKPSKEVEINVDFFDVRNDKNILLANGFMGYFVEEYENLNGLFR